jgi:hypothetical protein
VELSWHQEWPARESKPWLQSGQAIFDLELVSFPINQVGIQLEGTTLREDKLAQIEAKDTVI